MKIQTTLSILIIVITSITMKSQTQIWEQAGTILQGNAGDKFGRSVSMNSDGSVIAIGAYTNDFNGTGAGCVKIYQKQDGAWVQKGQTIYGLGENDYFGVSVSISSDGSIIAIGAYEYTYGTGYVQVFKYNGNNWVQIGLNITGENTGDFFGGYLSLSSDGNIIAITAISNDDNGESAGSVYVFKNLSDTWTQIGSSINGENGGDGFGSSVSLCANGSIVAIGAYRANDNNGQVRIFQNVSNNWEQIGSDINSEGEDDWFGNSVSISSDGSLVAVGATYYGGAENNGQVRTFNNQGGVWTQIGGTIVGAQAHDCFGGSVCLSKDGSILAVGYTTTDGTSTTKGRVQTFEIQDNVWTQTGQTIEGDEVNDWFGMSLSINENGKELVVGARYNDENGNYAGQVKAFSLKNEFTFNLGGSINFTIPESVFESIPAEDRIFTITLINGDPIPAWLIFDEASLTFSGTALDNAITLNIIITVSDGNKTVITYEFLLNIKNASDVNYLSANNILIYPNPTDGIFTINLQNIEMPCHILINDISGRTIRDNLLINKTTQINLSEQANGIYFIKITQNNKVFTGKIIKN